MVFGPAVGIKRTGEPTKLLICCEVITALVDCCRLNGRGVEAQVVPLDVKTFPEAPAAISLKAEVPSKVTSPGCEIFKELDGVGM